MKTNQLPEEAGLHGKDGGLYQAVFLVLSCRLTAE
jgi:hypothetical protein